MCRSENTPGFSPGVFSLAVMVGSHSPFGNAVDAVFSKDVIDAAFDAEPNPLWEDPTAGGPERKA